jgi:hypothetical protein
MTTNDMNTRIENAFGLKALKPFSPVAYFDCHMDCIRIELRDCSITETRINEHITILEDNYPGDRPLVAGLMLKGVRHLFIEWNLPLNGIVHVTSILNEVVKKYPEFAHQEIYKLVNAIDFSVNMSKEDVLAAA